METKFYICSKKRAEEWSADADNLVLGQRHEHDWVEFIPENKDLYNFWFTEKAARAYIFHHELEDCEVIQL